MADNTTKIVLTAEDKTAGAINSARAGLTSLQTSISGATAALGGIGAGLSLAGLAATIRTTIDAADAMNDLSQRVGISVRELGKYELAARQSGTSMESIAKGIKGLSGFMLENSAALKSIGITATDADGALQQLADLFKDMGEEGSIQKTALAVKLFGKAGMDLIPMLNQGSAGLQEAAEKSERYAKAMEAIAPLSDKFNDQMAELSLNSKVFGMNIAEYLLPGLIGLTKALNDLKAGGDRAAGVLEYLDEKFPIGFYLKWKSLAAMGGETRSRGYGGPLDQYGLPKSVADQAREREAADLAAFDAATADYMKRREASKRAAALLGKEPGAKEADKFGPVMKQVAEHTATLAAEAQATDKLTSAQTLALKIMADLQGGYLRLSAAQKIALTQSLESMLATDAEAAAHARMLEMAKAASKALDDQSAKRGAEIAAAERALEVYGLTEVQIIDLTMARTRENLARAAERDADEATLDYYARELEALERIRAAKSGIEGKEAAKRAAEESAKAWEHFSRDIESSLTDALMRSFEAGNGFGKSFVQTLENTLKTATLKIAVQAIVSPVMAGVQGLVGGGGSSGSGGLNLPGIPGGGGLYGTFATSEIGQSLGLSAAADFTGAATLTEAGLSVGAALPWVGGALALASAAGLFSGDGDAMRSSRYFSPFAYSNGPGDPTQANNADGSRYNYLNNSWFSADMQSTLDAFDQKLQESELAIAAKLGLQASDWAKINAQLAPLGDRRYDFGMEHTGVPQSTLDAIEADRFQAIAAGLGMSLQDLRDIMSGAKKSAYELAVETQKLSAEQAKAKAQGLLAGMAATLSGIDSVTGLRSGILASIAGVRGGNTYDSRMGGLQALLSGETDIGRQVELAGQIKDLVLERYQSERAAIQANQSAAEDAAAAMRAGLISIGAYARSLLLSDLSPLTAAQRISESASQFQTTLARARQGDTSAIGSLSGAAGTYLQESRSYYASSSQYSDVFGSVQGALAQLGLSADSVRTTGDWQAQLLAVDDAAARSLEDLAGVTEDWTVNLETLLVDQTAQFEALGLKLTDVADNTRGLDSRIAVLLDAALAARFDKLSAAVERSAQTTARAVTNAVQVTVRS